MLLYTIILYDTLITVLHCIQCCYSTHFEGEHVNDATGHCPSVHRLSQYGGHCEEEIRRLAENALWHNNLKVKW